TRGPGVPTVASRRIPVVAVLDPQRRNDHLGTMGRMDPGTRSPVTADEQLQPLLARLRRPLVLLGDPRHPAEHRIRGVPRPRARAAARPEPGMGTGRPG